MWSGDNSANNADADRANNEKAIKENTEMSDNLAAAAASSGPKERRNGRERSLSVPCRAQASDVETVMTKAKRASSYLWMLLHSQSCRLGVDRCTHVGCEDAKLVHLHMKTCPAGRDFPCPTRYPGCLEARKLLAHYRQCRNIRARQVGQAPSLKGQHVCLICSMVARQARSLLDNNTSTSKSPSSQQGPVIAHKKSSGNSKCPVVTSFTVKAKINSGTLSLSSGKNPGSRNQKKILASFTLSPDNRTAELFPRNRTSGPADEWDMPPPAPRIPGVSRSAPASPLGNAERQELTGKSSSPKPLPLFRKRSESLGCDTASGRRAVSFAPRPEFSDDVPDSLVSVELDPSEPSSKNRRGRSASCHLLSSSNPSETCGTIYEEIGPAASCMDE